MAPAYYEAVCATVASHQRDIEEMDAGALIQRLKRAFDSEEFKAATGPGANTIPKLHSRIEVVGRFLLGNERT